MPHSAAGLESPRRQLPTGHENSLAKTRRAPDDADELAAI
jgi:hypothetical protein